ncbi:MAG: ATP-dependent RNA helicase HrpA, partial [Victivallaceae bacterium]|nr:ATP-dependent RNA helicase HrpA [Victivallaceae bacterium]
KMRCDDRTGDETVIKFMTDGILLAESRSDRALDDYECIILDEAHERSLNIDFLLGILKTLSPKRPDLRIVISSATLESSRMSEFFGGAPIIEIPGGLHPIEDCFFPELAEKELSVAIAEAVRFASSLDPAGDALVFLPGEREIRDAAEHLRSLDFPRTEILPLYGRLAASEQKKIFHPSAARRIVLATNVAETSLTIPRIRFVIDSGLVRLSRYNPRLRLQELRVEFASQAAIRQRRGRCGRIGDGVCIHLYGEDALRDAPEYTSPEIQRASLAGVILQMAELRLPPVEEFPFLDPPGAALIREGRTTLGDLRALTPEGKLTPLGHELARLPVDPHLGKLLVDAKKVGELPVMAVIAAGLSLPDPAERPFDDVKKADAAHRAFENNRSDFLGMIALWRAVSDGEGRDPSESLRAFAKKNFYNFRRLREWKTLVGDLLEIFSPGKENVFESETRDAETRYDLIHKLLLGAMPRRLAVYDPEEKNYFDMNGKRFAIFPGSGLARRKNPPQWIVFLALMETSRVFARCVAEAKPEFLPEVAPQLCRKQYDQIRFEPERGYVTAREFITAGALPVSSGKRRNFASVDPAAAREVFLSEGVVRAQAHSRKCPWLEKYNRMRHDAESLEIRSRRPGRLLNEDALLDHFKNALPPEVNSVDAAEKLWAQEHRDYAPEKAVFFGDADEAAHCEKLFPETLEAGGIVLPLHYEFAPGESDDGVSALCRESDLDALPAGLGEWNVPGYLAWRAEALLKKLPKETRRALFPLAGCAADFAEAVADGSVFTENKLADALARFLADFYDCHVDPVFFDGAETPAFTQLKIVVTDSRGRALRTLTAVPPISGGFSRLALRRGDAEERGPWERPPDALVLPEKVEMRPSGQIAYPALDVDDDGLFSRADFLDEAQARYRHRRALLALHRQKFGQQTTYLERSCRFPNEVVMTFFLDYPDWRRDLVDLAISDAIGEDAFSLRSTQTIRNALLQASQTLGKKFDARVAQLNRLYPLFESAKRLIRRLPENSWSRDDAEYELIFLGRDGFLRAPSIFNATERILKALKLRLDRTVSAPLVRDEAKGEKISGFIERFQLAAAEYTLEDHPHLADFYLLLAEARIAVFSPEVGVKVKSPEAKLADAWKTLRLG